MNTTTYSLVTRKDGTCIVEVHEPGRETPIKQSFPTENDAQRWITEQQRMAEAADRWERKAPRNWRD